MKNNLGEFIRSKRLEKNMSLRELAKLCDISHTHLDSIEKGKDPRTGKRVNITNETIQKIASALNMDEEVLFKLSLGKNVDETELDENYIILSRAAKKMSSEQRKQLIDMAKIMFKEDFDK